MTSFLFSSRLGLALRLVPFYIGFFGIIGVHLPFWAVFLTTTKGLSEAEIGLVLGAANWIKILTNPLMASLADRSGRVRRVMAGLMVMAFAMHLLFFVAEGVWLLAAVSVVAIGAFAPVMPLGESVVLHHARQQGLTYGRLRLWGSLSFIGLAWLAGGAVERWGSWTVLWMILGLQLALLVACLLLPDSPTGEADKESDQRENKEAGKRTDATQNAAKEAGAEQDAGKACCADPAKPSRRFRLLRLSFDLDPGRFFSPARTLLGQAWFRALLLCVALIQGGHAIYYGFATLHWRQAGLGETTIGLLWAEGVVAEVVLFWISGWLVQRLGPVGLLALGGIGGLVRWSGLAVTTDLEALIGLQLLHALTFGATHLGAMHLLNQYAPSGSRATAQSLHSAFVIGLVLGSMMWLGGHIYEVWKGYAFLLPAAMGSVGLGLVVFWLRPLLQEVQEGRASEAVPGDQEGPAPPTPAARR